jgi:hypothetical protein
MILTRKQTVQEVVDELIKMNNWWSENYSKAPISFVDDCRNKISAYQVTLATYVGDAKEDQLNSERERKFTHHQKKKTLMTENDFSSIKAETEAIIACNELQKQADLSESYYTQLNLLLGQMNKVMEAMQQHIAIARKEKENAKA